ncbi:endonuclease/exonuclease/phosphatase family protein [uncultured Sphaerochaeta sp.]|uniref:endonuclease/exonuclease/phosphatase family protein n=1 Tax=uncultured Sphaerochaeta sp. TaxID=886478 RepID=UPI002A0A55E7|nr:endonuclease/exonuclease/phosphatase family protein [uncultured Sphaerochaeta sp.]
MERISIISLNLWNTEHWDARKECVTAFVQTYCSDIFCFQEVRETTLAVLDKALPEHQRIVGTEPGWICENSIYVKKDKFTILDRGRIELTMPEPYRGVFWTRLRTLEGKELLVATMHLTHQLNADELKTGIPYRHAEANTAARELNLLIQEKEAIVCGDFNDPVHPSRILHEIASFEDVFEHLGLCAPVTFPCPFLSEERYLVEAIDKIMVRGNLTPLMAMSPQYFHKGGVLSDHWPVMAMLEI